MRPVRHGDRRAGAARGARRRLHHIHHEIFHVDDGTSAARRPVVVDVGRAAGGRGHRQPRRAHDGHPDAEPRGDHPRRDPARRARTRPTPARAASAAPAGPASSPAQVRMDRNYALEPDEVAAGVVLACQSHPVTDDGRPRLRRLTMDGGRLDERRPTPARAPALVGALALVAGATCLAIGVGLSPHLVKDGLTATSVVALLAALTGLALLALGVRSVWRAGHLVARVLVVPLAVVLVATAALTLGQAVAATNVPRAALGDRTPQSVGLRHEDVTTFTDDGVRLAGWYVPSTNGAAVVLCHGAGSTRSSVLDHAAVLAAPGYGVLLVDARGHGASEGRAMDFGWYGDLRPPCGGGPARPTDRRRRRADRGRRPVDGRGAGHRRPGRRRPDQGGRGRGRHQPGGRRQGVALRRARGARAASRSSSTGSPTAPPTC